MVSFTVSYIRNMHYSYLKFLILEKHINSNCVVNGEMPRKYKTEKKTTTAEGKREYMRKYMHDYQMHKQKTVLIPDALTKQLIQKLWKILSESAEFQTLSPKERRQLKTQVKAFGLEMQQRFEELERETLRLVDEEMRKLSDRLAQLVEDLIAEKLALNKVVDARKLLAATLLSNKKTVTSQITVTETKP